MRRPRQFNKLKRSIFPVFKAGNFKLRFGSRTYVMGILNVTPDSFSDGGKFIDKDAAIRHAFRMVSVGADIIDIGGESTRPGAREVDTAEELRRVLPVISALSGKIGVPVSIDTRHAIVAEKAIKAGASIINDVSGLRHDSDMARVASEKRAGLIVMHMRGEPGNMQNKPSYNDVVKDIIEELRASVKIALRAGVKREKIIVDPGIGFGKNISDNMEILRRLSEFNILGRPICIGTSRKSFIGKALFIKNPIYRLTGTVATNVISIMNGAHIIRVHDVSDMVQASRMTDLVLNRISN